MHTIILKSDDIFYDTLNDIVKSSKTTKSELIRKIRGYQNGYYGGSLKGLMAKQVFGLTPEQVTALAEYISKLQ